MQPDNQQIPANYLDSIAVQQPAKTMNPIVLWVIIGGSLLLVGFLFLLISSAGGSNKTSIATVGATVSELKTISEESQENVQDSDLRTLNSSLFLVLTNANKDLQAPLAAANIDLAEKKNREVALVASEMAELKKRIEDARLNAVYDRTYAREMNFYLKSLRSELAIVYGQTNLDALKKVLETIDRNLAPLESSFGSFNGV